MLTKIIRALRWTEEKLENLLADLAANYARELLAAHGLVEIEIDHIKRNLKAEPTVTPIENEKNHRFTPSNETPLPKASLELLRADGAPYAIGKMASLRATTPNCDLWSGPEIVAALCVAGAAIAALLFCLATILKP